MMGSIQYASLAVWSDLKTNIVEIMAMMKEPRKAMRRLRDAATKGKAIMPRNEPMSGKVVPSARAVSMRDWGSSLRAEEMSSGEKKPMAQRPIIPEAPRNKPMRVLRRQRGSRNSSSEEPSFFCGPWEVLAFAARHASGSLRVNTMGMTRRDGTMPAKKSACQPE